jgi:hypothetical protein
MKLLSRVVAFWHRCVLAVIVEDVRRTEARFKELEERFKKEVSDI